MCSDLSLWNFIEVFHLLPHCGFKQRSSRDQKLESEIDKKTATLKGDSPDEWNTMKMKKVCKW